MVGCPTGGQHARGPLSIVRLTFCQSWPIGPAGAASLRAIAPNLIHGGIPAAREGRLVGYPSPTRLGTLRLRRAPGWRSCAGRRRIGVIMVSVWLPLGAPGSGELRSWDLLTRLHELGLRRGSCSPCLASPRNWSAAASRSATARGRADAKAKGVKFGRKPKAHGHRHVRRLSDGTRTAKPCARSGGATILSAATISRLSP